MGINCNKSTNKENMNSKTESTSDLSNLHINPENIMNNSLPKANNIEPSLTQKIKKSNNKATLVDNNAIKDFSKDKNNIPQAENNKNPKPEVVTEEQELDKNQSNNPQIKGSNQAPTGLNEINSDILLNLEKYKLYNELIKLKNKVQKLNKYYIDIIQSQKLEQNKNYNKDLELNNKLAQINHFKNENETLNEKIIKFNLFFLL